MKYIPTDKLIAEIESRMEDCKLPDGTFPTTTNIVRYEELSCLRNFITSLQQEQPGLPGIEDPGIPGKDFIPIEWVDACEMYGKWKIVKQEQPEVDLERDAVSYCYDNGINISPRQAKGIARHFYELGLNARKEI